MNSHHFLHHNSTTKNFHFSSNVVIELNACRLSSNQDRSNRKFTIKLHAILRAVIGLCVRLCLPFWGPMFESQSSTTPVCSTLAMRRIKKFSKMVIICFFTWIVLFLEKTSKKYGQPICLGKIYLHASRTHNLPIYHHANFHIPTYYMKTCRGLFQHYLRPISASGSNF